LPFDCHWRTDIHAVVDKGQGVAVKLN